MTRSLQNLRALCEPASAFAARLRAATPEIAALVVVETAVSFATGGDGSLLVEGLGAVCGAGAASLRFARLPEPLRRRFRRRQPRG